MRIKTQLLVVLAVYLIVMLPSSVLGFERTYFEADGETIIEADNKYIKIGMMRERCINATIKKRTTGDIHKLLDMGFDPFTYAQSMNAITTSLTEHEQVILMFERLKSPFEDEHMAFAGFNGSSSQTEVCLYPGKYSIEGYLIRQNPDNFVLEEDKREYCIGIGGGTTLQGSEKVKQMTEQGVGMLMGFIAAGGSVGAVLGAAVFLYTNVLGQCIGETKTITIPETDLGDTLVVGGVSLPEYTFSSTALDYGKMTFFVFSSPNPTIIEELAIMNDYYTLSESYPFLIQPHMG
ncbi:hypothetical protein HN419_06060 [Candidatus Woesearchaeota archaeon]|jgi:hypothetical protein|nr:hypothetical protein [Candidatus Woesearchaeota archaeon]MBT3537565.1 hypothetical protein [Candidatus Woesearchaeota archaeon]MBT4698375.1 hypothetical protein [Candidatus Woesearchaeota archaeon]MBT4716532.1 hypothetical protein [Candidatus Woesearchaeota archaeon]MBT7105234.1 hypothetical protein [Candidatus Woesearchaeota archaeon]